MLSLLFENVFKYSVYFDILFIFDLVINFFLEYYSNEEEEILIKNNSKIIKNYIFGWFFF